MTQHQEWTNEMEDFLRSILSDCNKELQHCEKMVVYSGRCKILWALPSIILSSIMSALSQGLKEDVQLVSYLSMSAFIIIAVTSSISIFFNYGGKCEHFNATCFKYQNLITDINEVLSKTVRGECSQVVRTIRMRYDSIVECTPNPY